MSGIDGAIFRDTQRAGCPEVHQDDLDAAKKEAKRCFAEARRANRAQTLTSLKAAYFMLARFSRTTLAKIEMPWYVGVLIVGAVFFVLATLLTFLVSSGLGVTIAVGILGLLVGAVLAFLLMFVPDDIGVAKAIVALEQQRSETSALDDAKVAYREAQERLEELARQQKLKAAYEEAASERDRLRDEYQVASGA